MLLTYCHKQNVFNTIENLYSLVIIKHLTKQRKIHKYEEDQINELNLITKIDKHPLIIETLKIVCIQTHMYVFVCS